MLHPRQLQCALAVAECGSFQLAAKSMGMTPSGMTQSIQRLESHFGVPLFVRNRGNISLTPAGKIAVEGADAILRRAEAIEREIQLANNPESGSLSVGIDPTLANALLASTLTRLLLEQPSMRFSVTNDDRISLLSKLGERDIDLLICYPDTRSTPSAYECIELSITSPIVVGRPGHPVSNLSDRRLHEYLQYPRLGARLPAWYLTWAEYQLAREGSDTAGIEDYFLYSNNLTLMKSVVQRSDALLGLFREDALPELAAGQLIEMNPSEWPASVPVEVIFPSERPLSKPAEALIDALVSDYPSNKHGGTL